MKNISNNLDLCLFTEMLNDRMHLYGFIFFQFINLDFSNNLKSRSYIFKGRPLFFISKLYYEFNIKAALVNFFKI